MLVINSLTIVKIARIVITVTVVVKAIVVNVNSDASRMVSSPPPGASRQADGQSTRARVTLAA